MMESDVKTKNTVKCKRCGKPIKLSASTISPLCGRCYTKDLISKKEDEKQSLYPPEELQETDKEPKKDELPRKRCERCGKPVNPGISSRKCPFCHESDLDDAEKYYGVQESTELNEKAPPGFPKSLHDKLLNQYKATPAKAYATMWKLHKQYGNKLESVVAEVIQKKKNTVD